MITLTETKPVSTEDLTHAIELKCSPVIGSLNMANALGGRETTTWRLVREFTLIQLIDEAIERGVDLSILKAACCDVLVMDTPPFRGAVGYDPRPRCGLCNRRHYIDKRYLEERRSGEPLSCGDSARFRNLPVTQWTKVTMIAAVEGEYHP